MGIIPIPRNTYIIQQFSIILYSVLITTFSVIIVISVFCKTSIEFSTNPFLFYKEQRVFVNKKTKKIKNFSIVLFLHLPKSHKGAQKTPGIPRASLSFVLFFFFSLDLSSLAGSFSHVVQLSSSYASASYYFDLFNLR